jgi:hypothetical protein
MTTTDLRWTPGSVIVTPAGRRYGVVNPEGKTYTNYGLAGGTLGGGLFVLGLGDISWLSAETVNASILEVESDEPSPVGLQDDCEVCNLNAKWHTKIFG